MYCSHYNVCCQYEIFSKVSKILGLVSEALKDIKNDLNPLIVVILSDRRFLYLQLQASCQA